MEMEDVARWAYVAFVAVAVAAGLAIGYLAFNAHPAGFDASSVAEINGWVLLIMLILGIIIGFTSITTKEMSPFLTATIALIVASAANVWAPLANIHLLLHYWATSVLNYIVAFAAPAAVIISVKSVFEIAKE